MKLTIALFGLLLALLAVCGHLAAWEARGPTAAAATAESATSGEWVPDAHGRLIRRGADGLWSPYAEFKCPECGGDGRLVGRYTGLVTPCWRCNGTGIVFPGLEERAQEPRDQMPGR